MLRAVLSRAQTEKLFDLCAFVHAGLDFPKMQQKQSADFAVLDVSKNEADGLWQTGFYVFGDVERVEAALRALHTM
jgi:hypothetical protein